MLQLRETSLCSSCSDHLINMSIFDTDWFDTVYSNETTPIATLSPTGKLTESEMVEEFVYKVILAVCLFGIAGNLLNFIVLSQKSLTYLMERMEKSAHYGLVALAVSDFFICLTTLPSVFYGTGKKSGGFGHNSFDFRLAYKLYGNGVINTFMLSSTWLTVTMAISRYIAICHPLQARLIIGKTFTIASLVAVFVVSVLFNVPRFLREEPRSVVVDGGRRMYFAYLGPLQRHPDAEVAFLWAYFAFGIVVPLCVLVFCNAHLVRTLRMSMLSRSDSQALFRSAAAQDATPRTTRQRSEQAACRITLTLIVIIVLYVVLFVPSELLNFFVDLAVQTSHNKEVFNVAVTVGNLLQAINFAVNFILYSAVNTYFRQVMCRMVYCGRCRSTDSAEVIRGYKRRAAVAGLDGRMLPQNFHARTSADSGHVGTRIRRQLYTSWRSSQVPTFGVSHV